MRQTWRWFGPHDRVTIQEARQAGAQGIVSALHYLPPGTPWPHHEIAQRQAQITEASSGALAWEVVESLPVSEAIKTQSEGWSEHIAAYKLSLEALAAAGITTICYNFMPVLDWTRTSLRATLRNGDAVRRSSLCCFRHSYPSAKRCSYFLHSRLSRQRQRVFCADGRPCTGRTQEGDPFGTSRVC